MCFFPPDPPEIDVPAARVKTRQSEKTPSESIEQRPELEDLGPPPCHFLPVPRPGLPICKMWTPGRRDLPCVFQGRVPAWRREIATAAANMGSCGSRNGSSSEVGIETQCRWACRVSVSRPLWLGGTGQSRRRRGLGRVPPRGSPRGGNWDSPSWSAFCAAGTVLNTECES